MTPWGGFAVHTVPSGTLITDERTGICATVDEGHIVQKRGELYVTKTYWDALLAVIPAAGTA